MHMWDCLLDVEMHMWDCLAGCRDAHVGLS